MMADLKRQAGATRPGVWNVPLTSVFWLEHALAHGTAKYGRFNWRDAPGIAVSTYVNAMMRHLAAYADGEDLAADSGVPHLAHIMANAAILLDAGVAGTLTDDRRHDKTVSILIEALSRKQGA